MQHELQDLIQGKGRDGKTDIIQKITAHLRTGKNAGIANEGEKYTKQQEEEGMIRVVPVLPDVPKGHLDALINSVCDGIHCSAAKYLDIKVLPFRGRDIMA